MSEKINLDDIWDAPNISVGEKLYGTLLFFLSKWYVWVGIFLFIFFTCVGGGNVKTSEDKSQNQSIEKTIIQPKDITVVKTGSRMSGSVIEVYAKNISSKILNGTVIIKVNYNDGSSHHEERPLKDFYPEEVREIGFPIYLDRGGFSSYSFVNK
ncbi:hypothetical protein [Dysgonomonas sp. 511]|uniref:hypothetical protein n=1 Tax=Dysgonomonas sp. 511 TaxID=2302930 RepID=UPI0013D50966|nr:hypothetical protein [Dysgonomonas sp. 511]NDV80096.1 hypothetical protein [Dysgonomonas sp. 511]